MAQRKKYKPRAYDIQRKETTVKALKMGIQQLRRQKEHQAGKPISKYKLSKHTGISINTINKYPEITDILSKDANPGIPLKNTVVKVSRIYSLGEAVSVITQLTDLYNGAVNKFNDCLKKNTALNLENVRLKNQMIELNRQLNKYLDKQ